MPNLKQKGKMVFFDGLYYNNVHLMTRLPPKEAPTKDEKLKNRAELDKLRIENERYMMEHPELNAAIQEFVYSVLKRKPEDVRAFAIDFFTRPIQETPK